MAPELLSSPPSPFMLTIPPPRPVSVNSLARAPVSATIPYQKGTGTRSTSAEIQIHDDSDAPTVMPSQLDCETPMDTEMEGTQLNAAESHPRRSELRFENLPIEIHEAILDHLFGERASAFTTTAPGKSSARSWTKALRHPRRKALSNLSLIARVWRPLVQDRIYRHIKVKGTMEGLAECGSWFDAHPYLAPYVRHIEVWVPVWGNRANKNASHQLPARRFNNEDAGMADVTALLQATMAWDNPDTNHIHNYNYHYSSHNATMEDIFRHVKEYFPEARILTLEGGHCKKPPMIRHFRNDPSGHSGKERLTPLPNIQTFVMRGAWNIMRDYQHWNNLSQALPSLREWHCTYAKPKIEGYETISRVLMRLSPSILHLNISLEGFYNKETGHSTLFSDSPRPPHLCYLLGEVAPRLESLSFTGKVCSCLFLAAQKSLPSMSKLKSLDLVVKTCCRDPRYDSGYPFVDDVSGITNMKFIRSFERLVVGAVQSLENHPLLDYLRIRFIDLDSACPLLNPYFQLINNQCSGLWSEWILDVLHETRPQASFVQLCDGIYPQYGPNDQVVGAVYPRIRPQSIHACMYKIIADASKP
ncbi:hypothetical protein ASPWEDRAFT_173909 [Aspergillus wentii DTO 134E9]|uniref:Uncharacterized protein n=1 Tax=Aspergillus wentii DTO 134E9 TaxID=1073089 RepID=A0A1L9RHU3_ASPWE|nr:uncharacterized protein ASPWEDRAFT_173909 [Aspergillus wentii DTO 134E9]OJJ34495.1 hypothetical protein ASPWEDRAFT_173909 [Aspergillus wentii DTO 134E9]